MNLYTEEFKRKNNFQHLYCLIRDINDASNRHKRASDLKRYLLNDLEIIEEKSDEILKWVIGIIGNEEFIDTGNFI